VSAWASEEGIALGQVATEAKSNEIKAIPELLQQIDLTNSLVTIDAMGCQKEVTGESRRALVRKGVSRSERTSPLGQCTDRPLCGRLRDYRPLDGTPIDRVD
jgi:hypothetical protein